MHTCKENDCCCVFIQTSPLSSFPLHHHHTLFSPSPNMGSTQKCSMYGPRKAPCTCRIQHVCPGLYGLLCVPKKISPKDELVGQILGVNWTLGCFNFLDNSWTEQIKVSITLHLDWGGGWHYMSQCGNQFGTISRWHTGESKWSLLGPAERIQSYHLLHNHRPGTLWEVKVVVFWYIENFRMRSLYILELFYQVKLFLFFPL